MQIGMQLMSYWSEFLQRVGQTSEFKMGWRDRDPIKIRPEDGLRPNSFMQAIRLLSSHLLFLLLLSFFSFPLSLVF